MNTQERKKLEKKVIATLKKYLKKEDTIILGISGGSDSVFLYEIIKKTPSIKAILAHLNHGLRGEESEQDEKFVKKIAQNYTIRTKKLNIAKLAKIRKKGLEETGRTERYKFFNQLAKKHQAKYILTAHHANDNIETILLNLTRGSGLQGLSGMQIKNGNLLRPLLDISKKQIKDYLKTEKIPYLNESSNKDKNFKRNFIRIEIIPKLKKTNPNLIETIAKNTKNLREINDFLNKKAKSWIKKNAINKKQTKFNAITFRQLHPALQKAILRKIHLTLLESTKNLETVHIKEALKIITENIGNKQKSMGRTIISLRNNIFSVEVKPY